MNDRKKSALLAVLIPALIFSSGGWALAQSDHGAAKMESHQGGMMGGGHEGGMMGGGHAGGMCGMMGGGMMGGGMMRGGMHDAMLMHGFHAWTHRLMAHARVMELSRDQMDKIDQMITTHLAKAIRDQAEVQALMVTLQKDLRAENIDLKSVEKQLQTSHSKTQQMQLEGIRLYTQVLNVLTPQQRGKLPDTIGTPFPAPWGKAGHGMTGAMPMRPHGTDQPAAPNHSGGTSRQ
ncbi:MAG: hypothetical protein C4519_12715 [Desulfobacteraceae bacterium]|nr:MAG: hypothetical protein C4519_12715 [Desulfobacteraceae bacterium]